MEQVGITIGTARSNHSGWTMQDDHNRDRSTMIIWPLASEIWVNVYSK